MENKVFVILGANGKIGFSLANYLLRKNCNIIIGDINFSKYKNLLKNNSKKILMVKTDITKPKSLDEVIKKGNIKFSKIDACINCAYPKSKGFKSTFENLEFKNLKEDLAAQLGGAILISQKFIKYFLKQGFGNLVLISSIQGVNAPKFEHYIGTKMNSPIEYTAIKSGIISITKYLAKYYRQKNIRVNCISPGGIKNNQNIKFVKKYKNACNSKGLLDPEDINETIYFLINENSKYINGQNIIIDDGWVL
tara:strand:+ start:14 stop:766 length:753 start_codon:yes stop_codon:yes gene_type:complete